VNKWPENPQGQAPNESQSLIVSGFSLSARPSLDNSDDADGQETSSTMSLPHPPELGHQCAGILQASSLWVGLQQAAFHPVGFALTSHSSIAHQDDNVTKEIAGLLCHLQPAAAASNFLSAASSRLSDRPGSFISLIFGARLISFHSSAL